MRYRPLPGFEKQVSVLCFGCWGITSDNMQWGERDESDSIAAMKTAIDGGVNFFDTAPMYADGDSEALLGRFLADNALHQEVMIATKIRPNMMRPDDVIKECNDSLARLRTDHVELLQTHWTDREVPLEDTWGAMLDLKRQGKVKHIGVCNMGTDDLGRVIPMASPVSNQIPYNLLWRVIENQIQPKCVENDIGILVYSPLQHGILTGRYASADEVPEGRARSKHFSTNRPHARHGEPGKEQETFSAIAKFAEIAQQSGRSMTDLALGWLLGQAGVTSVIAGAANAQQAEQNVRFVTEPLAEEWIEQLTQASEELKTAFGDNPDMWADRYR